MKAVTFEIEQFLLRMPSCEARENAIAKGKSTLRKAWNGLRRMGYEPYHIGYVWKDTWDFDNASAALSVTGRNEKGREKVWELEAYSYPAAREARLAHIPVREATP